MAYFVHGRAMAIHRGNGTVFKEIADVKQLLEVESMLLAELCIGRDIVKFAESSGKGDMSGVVWEALIVGM